MGTQKKAIRQSVSLPPRLARRVKALAKSHRTSANRVVIDLLEIGLKSKEAEKRRFLTLAGQLTESTDAREQHRLKQELARMTFGV